MLEELRNKTPKKLSEFKVNYIRDYLKDTIINMDNNQIQPTGLPKSNVIYYDLSDNSWACVRPSGTEPKVKIYVGVKGTSEDDALNKLDELEKAMKEIMGL